MSTIKSGPRRQYTVQSQNLSRRKSTPCIRAIRSDCDHPQYLKVQEQGIRRLHAYGIPASDAVGMAKLQNSLTRISNDVPRHWILMYSRTAALLAAGALHTNIAVGSKIIFSFGFTLFPGSPPAIVSFRRRAYYTE